MKWMRRLASRLEIRVLDVVFSVAILLIERRLAQLSARHRRRIEE